MKMAKSKWRESFIDKGYELALEGLIDTEIARKLGVSETTFYEFQKNHPEFTEAIRLGKIPKNQEVEQAALKSALGFTYEEVTTEFEKGLDGKPVPVKTRKTTKYIPPNPTGYRFWLMNRMPEDWRDIRHIEGNLGGSVVIIADEVTKDTLDGINELGTKSPKDSND
jgi:hypothetical protein